jgi:threonine dehydratase
VSLIPAARPPGVPLIGLADIEVADQVLADVVRRTPLEPSRALSERVGGPVLL